MPPTPSTILVIDDEPIAREALDALLAGEGYHLEFATNGIEGLQRALQVIPDVVLLDVMMPGLDGYDVCRRLRAEPLVAEVPILLITALDDRQAKLAGIRAGADDFLTKPFDSLELITRLQSITRLNRYRHLQVERTRFAWVLEQAREGYIIVNLRGQFQYANPQARLYLGLLPDLAMPSGEVFLDVARRQYHLEPEAAWSTWPELPPGGTTRYLVRPETPASKAVWVQVKTLTMPGDQQWGRLIQLRDVTDQVTTRHDMRKFHSTLSHKMLTPLSQMFSGLEVLSQPESLSPGEIRELAQEAFRGAQRLRDEIQDIFMYVLAPSLAKPGHGYALNGLTAQAQALQDTLELGSMTVNVAPELLNSRLALSAKAAELILWELLENTKKFHPRRAPNVSIDVWPYGEKFVRWQISDDGLTLAPDQLARVWEPYIQGEKFFTGEAAGMGLGLPLVAALIWQVGGHVSLTNRHQQVGVVVTLTLPLAG